METEKTSDNRQNNVINPINENLGCSKDGCENNPPQGLVDEVEKRSSRRDGDVNNTATRQDESDIYNVRTADSYVLFADLLATKAMMMDVNYDRDARRTYQKFVDIANSFRTQVENLSKDISDEDNTCVQSAIISDSYVVSVPAKPKWLRALIKRIAIFQKECIHMHHKLLRGGVSFGRMAIGSTGADRQLIIGQAFVKAHLLELKVASYPRIVFSDDVEISELNEKQFIGVDKDRMQYISFLEGVSDDELGEIRKTVEAGRNAAQKDLHDRQKWDWTLTYIDQVRGRCTDCCSNNQKTNA